jgi:hypothetical protein
MPEYETVHGCNGLHRVTHETIPYLWEFYHPLNGWVPYAEWSTVQVLLTEVMNLKFRRLIRR